MKRILSTAFICMLSLSSFAKETPDTLVVTTNPVMHCSGCENKIQKNIRFVKGVKKINTSVPKQEVTIVHDAKKLNYKELEKAFAKIGFKITKKTK